jgi:transcriptional regulator with XRE-family HTH domain
MGISAPQVQRLETGERRITIDLLENYCQAVGLDPLALFAGEVQVPIIGVIDVHSNILPLPAGSPSMTRAPHIVSDTENLAAVRWEARTRFELMTGHLAFFRASVRGIPEEAWGRRCLLRRADGTQRIGWPFKQDGQIHINETTGQVEFNVRLEWASPILAVVAPQVLR